MHHENYAFSLIQQGMKSLDLIARGLLITMVNVYDVDLCLASLILTSTIASESCFVTSCTMKIMATYSIERNQFLTSEVRVSKKKMSSSLSILKDKGKAAGVYSLLTN